MNINLNSALLLSLKLDDWLTQKLGYTAWQVDLGKPGKWLSDLNLDSPIFAYAKVDASNIKMLWYLCDIGFRVVDLAITLEAFTDAENEHDLAVPPFKKGGLGGILKAWNTKIPLNPPFTKGESERSEIVLRFAKIADCGAVGRIAGSAFRYSRFHLDPFIPSEVANSIKSGWAINYFCGKRGDGMVVAEENGQVVGFLQLLWQSEDCLIIDLIGVDPVYQGRGIGRKMIAHAACFGSNDQRKPKRMRVGTQAANIPSLRLYESLGFRQICAQYVMHYHRGRS